MLVSRSDLGITAKKGMIAHRSASYDRNNWSIGYGLDKSKISYEKSRSPSHN